MSKYTETVPSPKNVFVTLNEIVCIYWTINGTLLLLNFKNETYDQTS